MVHRMSSIVLGVIAISLTAASQPSSRFPRAFPTSATTSLPGPGDR